MGSTGSSSKSEFTSPRVLALFGGTSPAALACHMSTARAKGQGCVCVRCQADKRQAGLKMDHSYHTSTPSRKVRAWLGLE